jgi:hypothetical protein
VHPVVHELEYIGLKISPFKDFNLVCNIAIALLKTGVVTRVDPENLRFERSLSGSVRVFYSKLRLSARELAVVNVDSQGSL